MTERQRMDRCASAKVERIVEDVAFEDSTLNQASAEGFHTTPP